MEKKKRPFSVKVSILIKNYTVNLPNPPHWNFSKTSHLHTNPRMQNPFFPKTNEVARFCLESNQAKTSLNKTLKSKLVTTQINKFQSQQLKQTQIPQKDIGRKVNAMLVVQK